jgi:hypothetical protein
VFNQYRHIGDEKQMDEIIITAIEQFPTFLGLIVAIAILWRLVDRLLVKFDEFMAFQKQIIMLLLEAQDTELASRARSVLRSKIEDP